jgi:16S rRNA (cytosine967-C5)-methyltransferase
MKYTFRDHHLLQLLQQYEEQGTPLDLLISRYFRDNRALGSKDRAYVAENIYQMVRWRGLLDHLIGAPYTWERRLERLLEVEIAEYSEDESIPMHIRYSFPKGLFRLLVENYGEEVAGQIALVCNERAPFTVRVNELKMTRSELLDIWKREEYAVTPCTHSFTGIRFDERQNLFSTPEFSAGYFEVQDEASQQVAALVQAQPGEQVFDYCAGSGGKTLAFAPGMEQKGQIFLHDIREGVLFQARKRLKRAGIQNAQVVKPGTRKLNTLKKRMHWVLVDAPCSGSGTWRRNPDMKWKLTMDGVNNLVQLQREIVSNALAYLHPDGKLVYATCSLFSEENEGQLEYFREEFGLIPEGEPFKSMPTSGGMDGFFGVVLVRK